MIHNKELKEYGYIIHSLNLNPIVKTLTLNQDWNNLDQHFEKALEPNGYLSKQLKEFGEFNQVEHMISIRDANDPDQEDGIWHDDGSRNFALSLSLTTGEIEGGKLGFRQKYQNEIFLDTPQFGEAIIFLTGIHGYEHKIHRIEKGKRIILVVWLSN